MERRVKGKRAIWRVARCRLHTKVSMRGNNATNTIILGKGHVDSSRIAPHLFGTNYLVLKKTVAQCSQQYEA